MWMLQFCLSGKETIDTIHAFYEKNGSCKSQKTKVGGENHE